MGREFNDLFDEWSQTYDHTVSGIDPEYADVFDHYDDILNDVASRASGNVVEFGVGTGNLTQKLAQHGLRVFGFEPSEGMRKIAKKKLPSVHVMDGDFLVFDKPSVQIDTVVSTYAFHHLTDIEKARAFETYSDVLEKGGRIVFGDTVFVTEEAKAAMIRDAKQKQYYRLAEDLEREYYTTIPFLEDLSHKHGFSTTFTNWNPFVWVMDAKKRI
ncbi:class I SAM-dependent methyltransferase [Virgibacillus halophilus]|uniref:class I SAM-dependent methyltransferase n=1 Tax=Tigheibacillus halophilus TaxID=361280 RepID=UPI0036390C5D